MVDFGLYVTYILFFGAILLAVGMSLVSAIQNPKGFVRALYGIGGILILALICYAVADSTVTAEQAVLGVTPAESKLVGGGLLLFYVVLGVAVLGLIYSEINKVLK